ncbi:MAG TPA: ion channel [Candidatus Dormibacteraeota bacterium]|nr:ion channel [Candidatus Dormibacteraeota bacterium]
MTPAQIPEVVAGAALVVLTLYDLFQSVIVPRPAVGRLRMSTYAIRFTWLGWRRAGLRIGSAGRREGFLALFGPLSVVMLLVLWASGSILGYGLVLDALGDQLHPTQSFWGAIYLSAESVLTLGFGDIVAADAASRTMVILEAATGLSLFALTISLLFLLFNAFQRREVAVVELDALAGAPPSGITLLETCAREGIPEQLVRTFDEWRRWTAEVLESHLAFPLLIYFRSSHDNEAWPNSFAAILDASALVLSAVDGGPRGSARLLYKVGAHLVEDLGWYSGVQFEPDPLVEREEFDAACARLRDAGYHVHGGDAAWRTFVELRSRYAVPVNRLVQWLAVTPAPWTGDRSYLPHRDRRRHRTRGYPRP